MKKMEDLKIKVDVSEIDDTVKKISRLKELLEEVNALISSIGELKLSVMAESKS